MTLPEDRLDKQLRQFLSRHLDAEQLAELQAAANGRLKDCFGLYDTLQVGFSITFMLEHEAQPDYGLSQAQRAAFDAAFRALEQHTPAEILSAIRAFCSH